MKLRPIVMLLVLTRKQRLLGIVLLFILGVLLTGVVIYLPYKAITASISNVKIIVVDPGHGGTDSGSLGGGYAEKDLTLLVSQELAQALHDHGFLVLMTRTTDTDLTDQVKAEEEIELSKEDYQLRKQQGQTTHPLDRGVALGNRYPPVYRLGLRARLLLAQRKQADIMLSIHTNHYKAPGTHGSLTLYQEHSADSKLLAQCIQRYLGSLLPGRSHPDYLPDNFFILRNNNVPTVIVEIGFISSPRDREYMIDPEKRALLITAIVQGVRDYFSLKA